MVLGGGREDRQCVLGLCGSGGEDPPCTPGSFPQGAGAACAAEEGQPGMNGDLVSKTSLEPGATTQGLFTSNLTTEAALRWLSGRRGVLWTRGISGTTLLPLLTLPWLGGRGLEVSFQRRRFEESYCPQLKLP